METRSRQMYQAHLNDPRSVEREEERRRIHQQNLSLRSLIDIRDTVQVAAANSANGRTLEPEL